MVSLARAAFEFGYQCGVKRSRLVVTDDGLVDGADWVSRKGAEILGNAEPGEKTGRDPSSTPDVSDEVPGSTT
jgi:hypothetical protein